MVNANQIKWIPKFVVVNKLDKTILLYDNEPVVSILH